MFIKEEIAKRDLPVIWDGQGDWEERRLEIADILQRELFGYRPAEPEEEHFEILPAEPADGSFCAGKVRMLRLMIHTRLNGKAFSFPATGVIPRNRECIPFFIHINFRGNVPDKYMPTEEIADNGFAVFSFDYQTVTSDDLDFDNGLAGVIYGGRPREGADPGKIPMWSWAASRIMDYCQTLPELDMNKSAVVGHSRLGKTALYTGMLDERFQYVISNDSGFAGAALSRNRADRENGKTLCSAEFCVKNHMQWFAPNYAKYAGHEEDMPYDQHFLVAASAPRHVYVASAVDDYWSDPPTEYLSACLAGEVYEKLGLKGLVHPDRYPLPGEVFHEGHVGYHMRYGAHYFSREDWNLYFRYIRG